MQNSHKENIIIKIFSTCFLVFFAWLLIFAFVFNINDLIAYKLPIVLCFFAVICGFSFLLYKGMQKLYANSFAKRDKLWVGLIFLIMLLPQGFFVFNVYYQPGWDVSILTEGGYWLAMNEGIVDPVYFAQYPNNIPLLMVWAYLTKILMAFGGIDFLFFEIMVCTASLNLSVYVCWLLMRQYCGKIIAGVFAVICVPFLCFAPWIVIPYSDTATILFPILIFYLWLKAKNCQSHKHKALLYVAFGALAGIGYAFKPTVIIVLIAVCITDLLLYYKQFVKTFLYIALCFAVAFAMMFCAKQFTNKILASSGVSEEMIAQNEFPMAHWFNMGLSESISPVSGGTVYGKWHGEDVLTAGSANTYAEKTRVCLQAAMEKIQSRGILGTIGYYLQKIRWFMGDGTMYFNGESPVITPFQQTGIAQLMQKFFWFGGDKYWLTAHLLQGIWLFLIALCALPILKKHNGATPHLLCARMSLCGIIGFITLFEGRSRYLTNFLPLFVFAAACSVAVVLKTGESK